MFRTDMTVVVMIWCHISSTYSCYPQLLALFTQLISSFALINDDDWYTIQRVAFIPIAPRRTSNNHTYIEIIVRAMVYSCGGEYLLFGRKMLC